LEVLYPARDECLHPFDTSMASVNAPFIQRASTPPPNFSRELGKLPADVQIAFFDALPSSEPVYFDPPFIASDAKLITIISKQASLTDKQHHDLKISRHLPANAWNDDHIEVRYEMEQFYQAVSFPQRDKHYAALLHGDIAERWNNLSHANKRAVHLQHEVGNTVPWREWVGDFPEPWQGWDTQTKKVYLESEQWAFQNLSKQEWGVFSRAKFKKPWDLDASEIPVMKKAEQWANSLTLKDWKKYKDLRNGTEFTISITHLSHLRHLSKWAVDNLPDNEWIYTTYDPRESVPINRFKGNNLQSTTMQTPSLWPAEKIAARYKIAAHSQTMVADKFVDIKTNLNKLFTRHYPGYPRIDSSQSKDHSTTKLGIISQYWSQYEVSLGYNTDSKINAFKTLLERPTNINSWTTDQKFFTYLMDKNILVKFRTENYETAPTDSTKEWLHWVRNNEKSSVKIPGSMNNNNLEQASRAFLETHNGLGMAADEWINHKKTIWDDYPSLISHNS
jgi:hypothetical protein